MEPDKPSSPPASLLWWLAFVAEAIAALLDTIERDYVRAAGLYSLALLFLLLAIGGISEQPRWRKLLLYFLLLVSIGLLLYRFLGVKAT
jgi:hypothetical protein